MVLHNDDENIMDKTCEQRRSLTQMKTIRRLKPKIWKKLKNSTTHNEDFENFLLARQIECKRE